MGSALSMRQLVVGQAKHHRIRGVGPTRLMRDDGSAALPARTQCPAQSQPLASPWRAGDALHLQAGGFGWWPLKNFGRPAGWPHPQSVCAGECAQGAPAPELRSVTIWNEVSHGNKARIIVVLLAPASRRAGAVDRL